MGIKQAAKKLLHRWNRLSLKKRVIISVVFVFLAGYGLLFGISKNVVYAYSGEGCVKHLTLLPYLSKQVGTSGFNVKIDGLLKVHGYPIASTRTCFIATEAPKKGVTTVATSPFGSWFMSKRFALHIGDAPKAQVSDFAGKTLPVTRPVEISLDTPDEVYYYKLKVEDKTAKCDHKDSKLYCAIDTIELAQGVDYTATLVRYFGDKIVNEVGSGKITTLKALKLVSSSVAGGQIVYDKPANFVFEYDKELKVAEATLVTKAGESVDSETKTDGTKVVVTPKKELARNTEYVLTLEKAEAADGSALPEKLGIGFTMSGGPKVIGINVGTIGMATSGTIALTFDQDVANFDAVSSLVTINGLNAAVSGSGKRLTIQYTANLCTDFTILVKKGFKSGAEVVQTDDYNFAGRTICHTTQTVGYSVKGRAITSYIFGSGAKTILYTGAIHGNEQSARLLMNAWIDELEVNARSIPAGTRIVVIPSVNPDGVAANTRVNANNIDLNRNYPTSDWTKDVQTVTGSPFPSGGGSSAGSEPETKALMAYTIALAPSLTMSYHASASYAIANTCGNSASLADTYAKLSGYKNMTGVSGAFNYQITGTYHDWICEKLGRASVLIELSSNSSPEFSRNKAALWVMAKS